MGQKRGTRLVAALLPIVLVLSISVISPAQAVTVNVMTEDFEGAAFPPTGWSEAPEPKWTHEATCTEFTVDSACASITGPGLEKFRLVTPPINVSTLTNPKIDFDLFISDADSTAFFGVMNAGSTCDGFDAPGASTVHNPGQGGPTATDLTHQSLSIPTSASSYCLAFMFEQRDLNDPTDPTSPPVPTPATVKIDNIVISGDGPAPPPNDPPIAPGTASFNVVEDSPTTFTFSGATAVRDPNGDPLTFNLTAGPRFGSVSNVTFLAAGMTLTYTPNPNFDGERDVRGDVIGGDQFKFKVTDDEGADSPETTVTIDITAVNDAPTITGPDSADILEDMPWFAFSNGSLGARCTSAGCSASPDVPLGIADDAPGGPLATGYPLRMIIETTAAAGGTFSLANPTDLTFSEGDGTDDQRMVFTGLGDAIDFALQFGSSYEPAPGFVGTDTLRLFVDDQGHVGAGGSKSAEKLITLNIGAVNHRPTADSKSLTVSEHGSGNVTLTGDDVDGDTLTFAVVDQPAHGDLTGTPPNLTYTPVADYVGSDSFTYTANDGELTSFIATVSITVNDLADPPVIGPLEFTAIEDQPKTITLAPASNRDDVPITWEVGPPAAGTLLSNGVQIATGTTTLSSPDLTYVPSSNFNGSDSFLFRARATIEGAPYVSEFFTASINVQAMNDAPEASDQSISVRPGQVVAITLQGTDVDGDPLMFRLLDRPNNGTLTGTPPDLIYTAPSQEWQTSFAFEVSDGRAADFGFVQIRVTANQPDLTIRKAADPISSGLGFRVFNEDAVAQTIDVGAPPGTPTDIAIGIYNPGFLTDDYLVTGPAGPEGWDIRYLFRGEDVTNDVFAGKLFQMAPLGVLELTMRVTPPGTGETFKALVAARSLAADGESDAVAANITAGTFKPDVLVGESGGRADALGDDVYNSTGAQQAIEQRGASGQTVYSHFFIENDGTAPDDFVVQGDLGQGATWLRQTAEDTDVTNDVGLGSYVIDNLLPGQSAEVVLAYRVPDDAKGLKTFHLTATSVTKEEVSDTAISKIDAFGVGQPDLRIESQQRMRSLFGNFSPGGNDIYNDDAAGQTAYELLPAGSNNVFVIDLENESAADSLFAVDTAMRACLNIETIECGAPSEYGLHVKFWELNPRFFSAAEGNREITSSVLAGQEREGLGNSIVDRYFLEVSADPSAPVNANLVLSMRARSVGDPALRDKVEFDLRTVRFRPDVEVLGAGQLKGSNVYNDTGEGQTIDLDLASRDTQEIDYRVENDVLGNTLQYKDRISVTATPESNGFTVRYFAPGGEDITSEITSSGYLVQLGPLEKARFRVVVTSPSRANAGASLPIEFTATSLTSALNDDVIGTPGPVDVGGASGKVAYRPDAAVALDQTPVQTAPFIGDDVYDPLVGTQELADDAKMLNTKKYLFRLSNDGPAPDTLKASVEGDTDGFVMEVFDGATDVTSALRAGTYTIALPAGGSKDLSVEIRPGERARVDSRLAATFTVNSTTRPLGEADAARIVASAVITCDETSIHVGVVDIEGPCLMQTDKGYLSQQNLVLNGVELSLFGPPAVIDTTLQRLSTDMAELRFADLNYDTVVRIPATLDFMVRTRCGDYLFLDEWRSGSSTCATAGVQNFGEPLGLSAGDWVLSGDVNHLDQEPWGYALGNRLPPNTQELWRYAMTWLSDGNVRIEVPVPPPEGFDGAPASLPLTLGAPPDLEYVAAEFGELVMDGFDLFSFYDATYRHDLATDEGLLYGRVGLPQLPAMPGAAFGAKFSGSTGTPEWIFARIRTGLLEEGFPLLPPHVFLDTAAFLVEPEFPAAVGYVEADVWKLLATGTKGGGLPNFLLSLKGSLAYERERVSSRGEMYLLGIIGPLADAKVTVGSEGVRASMNWNYSVGLGTIDFGDLGTLDLGRLGLNAALDGSGGDSGFEVSGSGTLHVFDSNVGLNAVISSLGAAGCATSKVSSLGSGDVGMGVKWYDDGEPSLEFLTDCALGDYKDPDAPQHVDFDGFTTRFKAHLAEADQIDAFLQSLPQVAPPVIQRVLGSL